MVFVDHYNGHRPHRALALNTPHPTRPPFGAATSGDRSNVQIFRSLPQLGLDSRLSVPLQLLLTSPLRAIAGGPPDSPRNQKAGRCPMANHSNHPNHNDVVIRRKHGNPSTVHRLGHRRLPTSSSSASETLPSRKPLRIPSISGFERGLLTAPTRLCRLARLEKKKNPRCQNRRQTKVRQRLRSEGHHEND